MMDGHFEDVFNQYKEEGKINAVKELPKQMKGQERIVAVRRNEEDNIIAFKTHTGRELDYVTALEEAKAGKLFHVDVVHKYGRDIVRSEPDGIESNNFEYLPTF
ncbi:DUF3892 domain-containing protein (plasmid) [Pontibacillus sp. ALD_SL1]|uniref:DUF3892 domain-containing protein n=1 Tax=Pontibacillus sp. ALD_SL1 TaxID=2777185 RepID=UPI001A95D29C|nr:DUF3892 domain-containing protein [Pontibacillus sp. ALD_SL1]QST03114.1 DUF3892 domain-containing protein [Pontibacillus sp. ALD_SL1]